MSIVVAGKAAHTDRRRTTRVARRQLVLIGSTTAHAAVEHAGCVGLVDGTDVSGLGLACAYPRTRTNSLQSVAMDDAVRVPAIQQ